MSAREKTLVAWVFALCALVGYQQVVIQGAHDRTRMAIEQASRAVEQTQRAVKLVEFVISKREKEVETRPMWTFE